MQGFYAVLWREYLFFHRRFWTITASALVAPLLYLVTFGLGLGRSVNVGNVAYFDFLTPGIMALSTMSVSFHAIATPLTIARLYDRTLEEYLISPNSLFSFQTAKIVAGALRGLYAAAAIYCISLLAGANVHISFMFIFILLLNCLVFSSLGFWMALTISSHSDMAQFGNFIITPMIFICGTFFSLDTLPLLLKQCITLLPLTPASYGLRAAALGWDVPLWTIGTQFFYLCIFLFMGLRMSKKVEG